ncbi:hypothetical protein C0992_003834 [Termitomyces sp. T32_za158]|nr:hypothetical protein C0992_003834 [Termitomyces sp. T32_za158]
MDSFVAEIRKIPPVTRFLCGSTLAVTAPLLMNIVPAYKLIYTFGLAFKKLQVRLTPQKITDADADRKVMEIIHKFLHWRSVQFLCLTYLSSSLAPLGAQTSLMGLITLPVKYLPYVIIAMDVLVGGPGYAAQAVAGAVVGHVWWWSVWGSQPGSRGGVLLPYASAPAWLRNLVGEGNVPLPSGGAAANAGSSGGVHIVPPRRTLGNGSGSNSGGSSGSSGHSWGAGRTLGSS